jgi:hypothetical protein
MGEWVVGRDVLMDRLLRPWSLIHDTVAGSIRNRRWMSEWQVKTRVGELSKVLERGITIPFTRQAEESGSRHVEAANREKRAEGWGDWHNTRTLAKDHCLHEAVFRGRSNSM